MLFYIVKLLGAYLLSSFVDDSGHGFKTSVINIVFSTCNFSFEEFLIFLALFE